MKPWWIWDRGHRFHGATAISSFYFVSRHDKFVSWTSLAIIEQSSPYFWQIGFNAWSMHGCFFSVQTHCLNNSIYTLYDGYELKNIHACTSIQDQDQDSLLVKCQNDNHSPGPVIRELVPSSHQRSELSNTILCIVSRWDQRIGEGIPIPDSLGEEATFINICISNGSLKCHRVLISTMPSFGDKVICRYTGFTYKTFI